MDKVKFKLKRWALCAYHFEDYWYEFVRESITELPLADDIKLKESYSYNDFVKAFKDKANDSDWEYMISRFVYEEEIIDIEIGDWESVVEGIYSVYIFCENEKLRVDEFVTLHML